MDSVFDIPLAIAGPAIVASLCIFGVGGLLRIDPMAHLHAIAAVCLPGLSAPAR